MGVPKFYRYISERYPCLSEKLREFQIPEFDNLYLDMNGIIHVCSHPDDNPLQSTPEETIFKDIFYYIELMFRLIQPKKLFMMAVDGVAPRAKMNQQRGRRFRTAKDAEIAAARVMAKSGSVDPEERFDSNCITPGTEFMDKLHQQLKYFIVYKISTDKLWQRPKIILSGHDTPGEGEHKIMDYIRYLRSRDDWQPNTRHCLHGLDADLVMLGLCSHELHFSLLREEVKFGRNQKRPANPEEISYELLHLSLMRDYLDLEFQTLKDTLPFPYDLEKVIDDWVLMGFLVGNDFIPNLPSLHINENALHNLYQLYIEVLPILGGYINEAGVLNLERFEKYMNKLAEFDFEHFKEIESDLKYFEMKTSNKKMKNSTEALNDCSSKNEELMNMINSTKSALCDTEEDLIKWDEPETEDDFMKEFTKFKAKYYKEKMHFKEVNEEVLQRQAECYIRAIQWNLHYYYHGCPSWSWYYPYHYAPFISDIKDFTRLGQLDFELGMPFQPFQQLLGVLPPGSRTILPEAFRHLMVEPESPILRFYPENFVTDLNGKQQEWEAVVLLPFIEQEILVSAMEPYYKDLTPDEKRRNKHGPMAIYEYTSEDLGVREAPDYFPPVLSNHAKETIIFLKEIKVPSEKLKWGVLPGARESYWYGFPTLKFIPFTGKLKDAKVQVFQQPSRGLNMMLYLKGVRGADENLEPDQVKAVSLEEAANKYLDKEVYVGWPHMVKALVSCVISTNSKVTLSDDGSVVRSDLTRPEQFQWSMVGQELALKHRNRLGIEIGHVDVVIFAKKLIGAKYEFNENGEAVKKFNWASTATSHPLQTIVDNVNLLPCEKVCGGQPDNQVPLHVLFPRGQVAFLMKPELYGVEVKIRESSNKGTVTIKVQNEAEPNIDSAYALKEEYYEQYYQGSAAATMCGLGSSHLLSRITGTILIQTFENDPHSKVNIGLNMKFNKFSQEVVGYTKKMNGRFWNYSDKAVQVIKEYIEKFPDVVRYLCNHNEDVFMKKDFFASSENADTKIQEILKWLSDHPYSKAERRSVGSNILSEVVVKELEKIVTSDGWRNENTSILEVKPGELMLPVSQLNLMEPDSSAQHLLLDRVVNIRECHPVPLGLKGFIIGIETKDDEQATLYDISFDVPIINGFQLHTEEKRCYRLTRHAFINLSHGRRKHLNAGNNTSIQEKRKAFVAKSINSCGARFEDLKISAENSSSPKVSASSVKTRVFSSDKMEPNLRPDYSSGSNNVTKFFSAYRSPSFATNLGGVHGGNQNQETPNRQSSGGSFPNANSEFQAMWNHLQHQKVPSENVTLLQPNTSPSTKLSSAANEQTNALRKILKLRDTVSTTTSQPATNNNSNGALIQKQQLQQQQQQQAPSAASQQQPVQQHQPLRADQPNTLGRSPSQNQQQSCYHSHSCCAALINYCQRTGCSYPLYGYETNNATKEVSAVICFPDGIQVRGQPAKDKLTAAENAACLTLKRLTEGKQFGGRPFVKFGGGGTPNLIAGQQQSQQFHPQQTIARLANQMTDLPSPPHQWCQQQNRRENWRLQDNTPHRPSPSFSANSFVPLQAQVPRHQQANKSTSDNKAAVGEQHLQEVVSKLGTTNAGGIIVVDKSSVTTSLQNENVKSEKKIPHMTGGGQNPELPIVLAPQKFMVDNKKMSTTTGTTTGSITVCQQSPLQNQQQQHPMRQTFQKRTKSRLAARFSVPPTTPPAKE
ncbi:5'-3' exoribonuclease pacman isoform X2 [Rhodnius prolixus]|uniref:5'-3' exoribonuclease pacman isoform X2 n=1 Tax=Rhodnius prolixus TaxID=13249 RepID=UPI003D188A01